MRQLIFFGLIFLISVNILGCGNGGGIGNDESIGSVTQNLNEGWVAIEQGYPDNAITKFTNALNFSDDATTDVAAKTGLAWAYAKKGDLNEAIEYFLKVQNRNNDANVGLAGAYLARGNTDDFSKAVTLLEHIEQYGGGLDNYASPHTGVSNAEAYAMLAYCCYLDGNEEKAKLYIKSARTIDINNDSVVNITQTLEILGLEIPQ
jgi:tetratricopeptide (TPR) repeat protein